METPTRKEKITACALSAYSMVYLLGCLHLKAGKIENPGSGLMPWLIGILMLFFTSVNLFRVFRGGKAPKDMKSKKKADPANFRASFGIALSVFIYPLFLHYMKFILATFLVVFFMLAVLKYTKPIYSLLISLTVAMVSFVIFSMLLGVTLPGGVLEYHVLRLF